MSVKLLECTNAIQSKNRSSTSEMLKKTKSFPLHRAVEYRSLHKIKILLPKVKDINEENERGYTPLLLACEQNDNQEIFDALLVRKDIDFSFTNKDGFNALHFLAFGGNFKGLVAVLKAFPDIDVNAVNDKGNTPLIMACKIGYLRIIEYLIAKGADVNHQNHKQYTALHYAANGGHTEVVELLLEYDAEVNNKDDYGLTPLIKASKWGFTETCKVLLENGADVNVFCKYQTALTSSCINNTEELTNMLISYGAKVNFPGPYSSALITCAREGSVECAKTLIEAGANVNGRMRNGKTALDVARENKHVDMVKLLSKLI